MSPPAKNMVIPKVPTTYTQQNEGLKHSSKRYGKIVSKVLQIAQSLSCFSKHELKGHLN